MSRLISALQTEDALTANMAVTHSSTDSALLDLFSVAGSLRNVSESEILGLWTKAYHENKDLALRMLLWIRDCRGGAGERRTFRVIYNYLVENYKADILRLLHKVPEVGRWDDLWARGVLSGAETVFITDNLNNALLCKWLPRKGPIFTQIAEAKKWSFSKLRRHLSSTSKTVEQQMSARRWCDINYESVPSRAMSIYSKSYRKRDGSRFDSYLSKVSKGEAKINSSALYPYDLIRNIRSGKPEIVINEQWKALPNYGSSDENMLVLADVSGSMMSAINGNVIPYDVSISLAIYLSERNHGIFKDCFITFTDTPRLQKLSGKLTKRYGQITGSVGYNTNFQAAFDLVLQKAIANNIPENEMPAKIIAISDMEFDSCGPSPNFDLIKKKYRAAGYKMPQMVFWNVNGRAGNCPVKVNTDGVALVSGASPSIMKSVVGDSLSPYDVMLSTINVERYKI